MITLTSDDVNYLVFRYLQESGFSHTAFALHHESKLNRNFINGNEVPPGALISLIQKGMQLMELEANVQDSLLESDRDFELLEAKDILTNDVDQLRRIILERRAERDRKSAEEKKEKDRLVKEKEKIKEREKQEKERKEKEKVEKLQRENEEKKRKLEEALGPDDMEVDEDPKTIESSEVLSFDGHTSEVFTCAWNPTGTLVASGAGDSTARIWNVADKQKKPLLLRHTKEKQDVTTLDWNGDGSLLATGCYDGIARIWTKDGELRSSFDKHQGPIFSLKWNKKADSLLTGGADKTAIVWDVKSGEVKQQFSFHTEPTLDVDWRNNSSFATCSTDKMIYVCKVGETKPLKSFVGHQDEVNAIRWDPTGNLLASCSDDFTAKIWSLKSDKCLLNFARHTKGIYTIKWSPTGPGTNNPNSQLLLASASNDSTIKLWDMEKGVDLITFTGHNHPVYSVAFSPDGKFVASGSFDHHLHIWQAHDGSLVKSFKGGGGIFEVCWNKEGNKVAACFTNNTVCVVDFRS